tara:strand:+ start:13336 stop:14022 length:687 start_codon:yes stop_codon:yes gene_type:complete
MKNIFYLILLSILIMSCGSNVESPSPIVTETEPEVLTTKKVLTQEEIDSFYDEITLGTEFGEHSSQRYWYKEDVYIYLCDRQDSLYVKEITKIVEELNSLIETVNISVTHYKNKANLFLWISENPNNFIDGTKTTSDRTIAHLNSAAGMVVGGLKHSSNEIKFTYVFVRKTNDLNFDKCTLREEITQSLGFFRDTYSFSTSIFSQYKTEQVLEYTELDKAIIKKHYSN